MQLDCLLGYAANDNNNVAFIRNILDQLHKSCFSFGLAKDHDSSKLAQ